MARISSPVGITATTGPDQYRQHLNSPTADGGEVDRPDPVSCAEDECHGEPLSSWVYRRLDRRYDRTVDKAGLSGADCAVGPCS